MKTAILVIFLFFSSFIFSQECIVKLNLKLCTNCYASYGVIDSLSHFYKTTLLIDGDMSEKKARYIISKRIPAINKKYNIIVSDSLYNKFSNSFETEVYILDSNNNIIFNAALPDVFNQNFNLISLLTNRECREKKLFSIPDNMLLSAASKVIMSDNYIYITDTYFNEFHFINNSDNSVFSFNPDSIDIKRYYDLCFKDTMPYYLYKKYYAQIKITNNDAIKIHDSYFDKNKVYILISIPYLKKKEGERFILTNKLAIVEFIDGEEDKFLLIDDLNVDDYGLDGTFFVNNEDFYFGIMDTKSDTNNLLIYVKYEIENDRIIFKEFLDLKLPAFYIKNKLYHNLFTRLPDFPYCFFSFTTNYYNILTGEIFNLPIKQGPFYFDLENVKMVESDFNIIDIYKKGDILSIIYYNHNNNSNYFTFVNLQTNKLIIDPVEVDFDKYSRMLSYGLINSNTFYIITDNTIYSEKFSLLNK